MGVCVKNFKHIRVVYFFPAESDGGVHFTLSIKIKELEPIFRNLGSHDIRRSAPPGGENRNFFFSQNFVDMYACLGSPITPKMLTQILEAMFPPLKIRTKN